MKGTKIVLKTDKIGMTKKITKKKQPNKRNKTTFKKGDNTMQKLKAGRKAMTPEEKALALASRTQFKLLLAKYASWDIDQVEKALEERILPVLELGLLKHLKELMTNGSMDRVDWTLNHMLGKPKETSHVKIESVGGDEIDTSKLSKQELLALKAMKEKARK